jgi:hypothetical protein
MMKYYKHVITEDGVKRTRYFQPEGTNVCIPEVEDNMDYARMMDDPETVIEEIVDAE